MLIVGDARHIPLADESVQCVVTSPPYWGLRDYGVDGQLGLEKTPEEYVENMVGVFREVRRVLRGDGTLWLNLGDSYANTSGGLGKQWSNAGTVQMRGRTKEIPFGLKPKDLVGIPWRVAFALQSDGWYLRSDIIWSKPNPMPESVTDRPTKAHEYLFLLAKSGRYYYEADSIRGGFRDASLVTKRRSSGMAKRIEMGELARTTPVGRTCGVHAKGRNKRTVWSVNTSPYSKAHFATFPPKLIEPCIKAGCPVGGIVFDPFVGSGTTVEVARSLGRQGIGLDLSRDYLHGLATERIKTTMGMGW